MQSGKIIAASVAVIAAIAGGALYYLQVFGYYERLEANEVSVSLTRKENQAPEVIATRAVSAINADSSPIRYRACFETELTTKSAAEIYAPHPSALPLVAPFWFGCFDATELGEDLENNRAMAFLGVENITYGIDEIVVIYPDGRGYAWRQINRCGQTVFKGKPAPEGCPQPPKKSP